MNSIGSVVSVRRTSSVCEHRLRGTVVTICIAAFVAVAGCKGKESKNVEASHSLEQAFNTNAPEAKQTVEAASSAIKSAAKAPDVSSQRAQYVEALRQANALATQPQLAPGQIKALSDVLKQVQQAVSENPALMDQNLYNAKAALAIQLRRLGAMN